jgi:hypothetical protein
MILQFPDSTAPTITSSRSKTTTRPTTRVTRYAAAPTNKGSKGETYVQSTTRPTSPEQTTATSAEQTVSKRVQNNFEFK